jgi:hypothetical protein
MSTVDSITTGVRAIAETTALHFVEGRLGNRELRDAIQTVRLGPNAVRIGDWDILAKIDGDHRTYDIRCKKTGNIVCDEVPYYDTALILVGELNRGISHRSWTFQNRVRDGHEFNRLKSDIEFYRDRIDHYYETGDDTKCILLENRLGAAMGRYEVLRHKLKCPQI